jgi:hypothetical protein
MSTKHINALFDKNVAFLMLDEVVYKLITGL